MGTVLEFIYLISYLQTYFFLNAHRATNRGTPYQFRKGDHPAAFLAFPHKNHSPPPPIHAKVNMGTGYFFDKQLAPFSFGVETKNLVKAVQRNLDRFPADFMFQVTNQEFKDLRSQFVTASSWGGRRTPPYAFSKKGVAMLSSVLHSPRAVQVNIEIMRTFVRLRRLLASNAELAERLDQLERWPVLRGLRDDPAVDGAGGEEARADWGRGGGVRCA